MLLSVSNDNEFITTFLSPFPCSVEMKESKRVFPSTAIPLSLFLALFFIVFFFKIETLAA
jgi:hypothetical protein